MSVEKTVLISAQKEESINNNKRKKNSKALNPFVFTKREVLLITPKFEGNYDLELVKKKESDYLRKKRKKFKSPLKLKKNIKSKPKVIQKAKLKSHNHKRIQTSQICRYSNNLSTLEKCKYIISQLKDKSSFSYFLNSKSNDIYEYIIQLENKIQLFKSAKELLDDLNNFFNDYSAKIEDNCDSKHKIQNVLNIIKDIQDEIHDYNQRNKENKNVPLKYKPMTTKEKSNLVSNIRALPKSQLQGLIIFMNKDEEYIEKTGFYEIDVEKLEANKLRVIEKYVNCCRKTNGNDIPDKYKEKYKEKYINKKTHEDNSQKNDSNSNKDGNSCNND